MFIKEKNRTEIEERLKKMGDYAKMDYLQRCLKQQLDFDTRKFALLKLAEIYENKKMFLEAGKMMDAAANINTTFQGKIKDFLKSAELFVKGGDFDKADITFDKAIACGNTRDREEIKRKKKEFYNVQAEFYFNKDKRKNALLAYEKFLTLDLQEAEKRTAQERLLYLYEKLGKIRDYYSLKRMM